MIERGIARRYVRALFDLAVEQKIEKEVFADLTAFHGFVTSDDELRSFLRDPRISETQKKDALAKALPPSFQELSKDFFLMVVDRGRAPLLETAADEFALLFNEHQGVEKVDVTSAVKLDSETTSALIETLEKATKKRVELSTHVDTEILGGLKIRMGSTLFDGSLQRELEEMRGELKKFTLPVPTPMVLSLDEAPEGDDASGEDAP